MQYFIRYLIIMTAPLWMALSVYNVLLWLIFTGQEYLCFLAVIVIVLLEFVGLILFIEKTDDL